MPTPEQRMKSLEAQAKSAVRFAPGGGAVAAARLTVGSGATIGQISKYQFTLAAVSVGANVVALATVTIPGLALNDWVLVVPPEITSAPMCTAHVFAVNTLRIGFVNPTTIAQNSPAGTYTVIAIRA